MPQIPTIHIPICDENLWILKVYSHLFERFWGDEQKVVIMGFKNPDFDLPKNFHFISLAEKQEGGPNKWSRYIHDYLVTIDDEYIIFSLEDFFPIQKPNKEILYNLIEIIQNDQTIGRCDITWDSFINIFDKNNKEKARGTYKALQKNKDYTVIYVPPNAPYRISTQPSIWRKDYLLKLLDNDWTPWQFEILGTQTAAMLADKVIAAADSTFINYATKWIHKGALSRYHKDKVNVLGLDMKTIKEMVELDLVSENNLQWGQWNGPVPQFHDLGAYDFHPIEMPVHESSPTNWKEYHHLYNDSDSDTMLVNLFDGNFSHTRGLPGWGYITSQAELAPRSDKIKYIPQQKRFLDYSGVTIFTDRFLNSPMVDLVETKYKIAWIQEPPAVHPWAFEVIEKVVDKFDFVFSYDKKLTEKYENCVLFPYAQIVIPQDKWKIHKKLKLFSTIASKKNYTTGHKLRHTVVKKLAEKHSIDIYGRGYKPFPEHGKIIALKDYMFSIVIQNTMLDTMFGDIVDPLITGTVPIFWGTKEVKKYFDQDGIIFFETLDELDDILSNLTEEDYYSRMPSIKKNFELVKRFWRSDDQLASLINEMVSQEG